MTNPTMQAHGFVWPKGLPKCAMCGRDANDKIHVTPNRGGPTNSIMSTMVGGGLPRVSAADRARSNMPSQAHGFMLSSPMLTNSVTCQTCGNTLSNGVHSIGLPSGMVPLSSNSGLYGSGLSATFSSESLSSQVAFVAEIGHKLVFAAPVTTEFRESQLPREIASQWQQAKDANPYFTWVAGRYVEADRPNRNAAYWSTADLELGQPTVTHGPINWLHEERHIIGTIAGSEMVHVDKEKASADGVGNHIVMLGAIWSHIYPQEANVIQRASEHGKLWASMECVSQQVACLVCKKSLSYPDYMHQEARCEHMRNGMPRRFIDPTFGGAGIIVPPVRPGWANADVRVLMSEAAKVAERQAASFGDMSTSEAELLVAEIMASVEPDLSTYESPARRARASQKPNPAADAETEKINAHKDQYAGVHKFKAATWTHANGHPRCVLCGQEESMSPECNREPTQAEQAKLADLDITDLIFAEHEDLRRRFAELVGLKTGAEEAWDSLASLLAVHAAAEEAILYPAIVKAAYKDADAETADALGDHNLIRKSIRDAAKVTGESPEWWKIVKECRGVTEPHLLDEERDVLPDFREDSTPKLRLKLGAEWVAFHAAHIGGREITDNDVDPTKFIGANS
jgi:Hemerythrin HHE cation binding domain